MPITGRFVVVYLLSKQFRFGTHHRTVCDGGKAENPAGSGPTASCFFFYPQLIYDAGVLAVSPQPLQFTL
jgi:hypothetical protein